jgi:phosphoglucosamine mutase
MSEAGTLEECEKHVDYIINAMKESGHLVEVKK